MRNQETAARAAYASGFSGRCAQSQKSGILRLVALAALSGLVIASVLPTHIAHAQTLDTVPPFLADVVDPNVYKVGRQTTTELRLTSEVFCPSNASTGENALCPAEAGILILELPSVRWSGVEGDRCPFGQATDRGTNLTRLPRFLNEFPMILEEDIVPSTNLADFMTNSFVVATSGAFGIIDPANPMLAEVISQEREAQWELRKEEIAAEDRYIIWARSDQGCSDADSEFGITYSLTTLQPNFRVGDNSTATISVTLADGVDQQYTIQFNAPLINSSEPGVLSLNNPTPPGTATLGPAARQVTRQVPFTAAAEGTTGLTSLAEISNVDTGVSKSFSGAANVTVLPPAETIVNSVDDVSREAGSSGCDTGNLVIVDGVMVPECTLRAAIETVNIEGSGTISFAIPIIPATQVPRIILRSALPQIAVPVVIEGTTQTAGKVELFGGLAEINGLILRGGDSFVSGLVMNGFVRDPADDNGVAGVAIGIVDNGNNHIFGNFIGTDASGELAVPTGWGVFVLPGASGNAIGGPSAQERNIIVATNIGVDLRSDANRVENNFIGTNVTGSAALESSLAGVLIAGNDNSVGGPSPNQRNVVLSTRGVVIAQPGASGIPERNNIVGNSIGLLADGNTPINGSFDTGVLIRNGSTNTVRNNQIVVQDLDENSAVLVDPTETVFVDEASSSGTVSNTTIEGNEIGLTQSGTSTLDNDICLKVGSTRLYAATDGSAIIDTIVENNQIAGCRDSILVIGDAVSGTQIVNNQIGLRFDGSGQLPSGLVSNPVNGVLVGASPDTVIDRNRIAGHTANVSLIGSDQRNIAPGDAETPSNFQATGFVVTGNTIGLNSLEAVPSGSDQDVGVVVFGNPGPVTITNNSVAGHGQQDVWLVTGREHVVAGNRIGTTTGSDHGSSIGILVGDAEAVRIGGPGLEERNVIGRNRKVGIELHPGIDALIQNNHIGTDVGGLNAWPNDVGILAETVGTTGLVIEDNRLSGNDGSGVFLANLGDEVVMLSRNLIGSGTGGAALPNAVGVSVNDTRVVMHSNRVAFNQQSGVLVQGTRSALIERGPIFENNNRGIVYETPPHDPIPIVAARSTVDANGNVLLIFSAQPEDDVNGILEIYGNDDCSNPEGKVPVLQQPIFWNEVRDQPFVAALRVTDDSVFATLNGFTATLTIGDSTSTFSSCDAPVTLEDSDGDGVPDFIENIAGDLNGDGEPDSQQPSIASVFVNLEDLLEGIVPDPDDDSVQFVAVESESGTSLSNVVFSDATGVDLQPAEGETRTILELPSGLISFEVNLPIGSDGASAEVAIALIPIQDNYSYIKVTDPGAMSTFRVLPETGSGDRATKTGAGWVLRLTDGGEYDTDGVANGVITDPGGPAVLSEPEDTTGTPQRGGGGGCTVGSTDQVDPTLPLLALLSLIFIHRRKWIALAAR